MMMSRVEKYWSGLLNRGENFGSKCTETDFIGEGDTGGNVRGCSI